MTGRTKVAELDGCCRTVVGSVKVALKKGSAYYIMGRVNEGGGGENLNVGMQKFTGKVMPIPMSMFDSGKSVKCGPDIDGKMTTGYACRHWWFDVGGVKIPDPINQENYKTFKTGLGQVMTPSADSGLFEITGNDVFTTDNNMGSQLEGFIKAPADGDYFFYVYRSARPSSRPAGSDRSRRCCYGCCYGCSRLRLAVLVCSLTPSHRAWHHPRPLFACERSNSDDSSEVWASDVDGVTPSSPQSNVGLKKFVELNGCCREVTGRMKLKWKKGGVYDITGLVKEGGGGECLHIGHKRDAPPIMANLVCPRFKFFPETTADKAGDGTDTGEADSSEMTALAGGGNFWIGRSDRGEKDAGKQGGGSAAEGALRSWDKGEARGAYKGAGGGFYAQDPALSARAVAIGSSSSSSSSSNSNTKTMRVAGVDTCAVDAGNQGKRLNSGDNSWGDIFAVKRVL